MIVEGFGVSLERLTEKDLELVREKRNSPTVSQFMEFRGHITPAMQQDWFRSVNNIHNLYYVITYNRQKVGLINGAKIDWDKMETASGGIFIWEEDLWQTIVPIMANLVLMDISIFLGLKRSFIKVMNDNLRAIRYNALMGYKPWSDEGGSSKIYVLENEDYLGKTKTLRSYLSKKYGDTFNLVIDDPGNPITEFLLERIALMPEAYRARLHMVHPLT